jgi:hypothetical protein
VPAGRRLLEGRAHEIGDAQRRPSAAPVIAIVPPVDTPVTGRKEAVIG